jgi:predicted SAM-dependent methyltransferase
MSLTIIYVCIPERFMAVTSRRLHIGGQTRSDGWEILDALQRPEVDHLGNAQDLSRFPDETFDEMYASHVIEHFDYKGAIQAALREWRRVLTPSGCLYLSFPDLGVLSAMYASGKLTLQQRFQVMRMIFGGHIDAFDYHLVGLDYDLMKAILLEAGYASVEKVNNFGLFQDTSQMMFAGVKISCNVVAFKR